MKMLLGLIALLCVAKTVSAAVPSGVELPLYAAENVTFKPDIEQDAVFKITLSEDVSVFGSAAKSLFNCELRTKTKFKLQTQRLYLAHANVI